MTDLTDKVAIVTGGGRVGSRLLSQDERVRVWEIRLEAGQRFRPHRHVLDYFWTAVTPGRSRRRHHP